MKRSFQILLILCAFGLLVASNALGMDKSPKKPWRGELADGTEIKEDELKNILREHEIWLHSNGKAGRKADLSNAFLIGIDLSNTKLMAANFSNSNLYNANLNNADLESGHLINVNLHDANLSNANFEDANLSNASLPFTNLSNANFLRANLSGASLMYANMSNASLRLADLNGAFLNASNLSNSDVWGANLAGCNMRDVKGFPLPELGAVEPFRKELASFVLPVYEPKAGSVPDIPSMVGLPNLENLTYNDHPHGLVDLREGFKKLGYKEQERKITYALQHTETNALLNSTNIFDRIEGWLRLYLLEHTSKWGMSPGRPLFILLWLIPIFSFIYMFSLIGINEKDGIWKVWIKERVRWDLGEVRPEKPLNCSKAYQIWGYGLYFSILSAFNIGWRELNVGNWIARVQPREYTLRASGWVRTVSGIQSLTSVYLLALAVLTYFGRPFDQF